MSGVGVGVCAAGSPLQATLPAKPARNKKTRAAKLPCRKRDRTGESLQGPKVRDGPLWAVSVPCGRWFAECRGDSLMAPFVVGKGWRQTWFRDFPTPGGPPRSGGSSLPPCDSGSGPSWCGPCRRPSRLQGGLQWTNPNRVRERRAAGRTVCRRPLSR